MNFWGNYSAKVIKFCLIPFIIYFCSTVLYFSNEMIDEDFHENFKPFSPSLEFFNRMVTIIGMIYFGIYEIIQMYRDRLDYFKDLWNYFDLGSIILNTFLLINLLGDKKWIESKDNLVVLVFIAVFILWWKLIYWFRLFESTSFYIRLIIDTISGIGYFFTIFLVLLLAFSNAIYILNSNRCDPDAENIPADCLDSDGNVVENELFEGTFNNKEASAFMNQY